MHRPTITTLTSTPDWSLLQRNNTIVIPVILPILSTLVCVLLLKKTGSLSTKMHLLLEHFIFQPGSSLHPQHWTVQWIVQVKGLWGGVNQFILKVPRRICCLDPESLVFSRWYIGFCFRVLQWTNLLEWKSYDKRHAVNGGGQSIGDKVLQRWAVLLARESGLFSRGEAVLIRTRNNFSFDKGEVLLEATQFWWEPEINF